MNQAEQLIGEAVFYEINNQRWHQGLWDNLKSYIPELEQKLTTAIEYLSKYPGSHDARNHVKALSNILDSVSQSHRSWELLKRGAK